MNGYYSGNYDPEHYQSILDLYRQTARIALIRRCFSYLCRWEGAQSISDPEQFAPPAPTMSDISRRCAEALSPFELFAQDHLRSRGYEKATLDWRADSILKLLADFNREQGSDDPTPREIWRLPCSREAAGEDHLSRDFRIAWEHRTRADFAAACGERECFWEEIGIAEEAYTRALAEAHLRSRAGAKRGRRGQRKA